MQTTLRSTGFVIEDDRIVGPQASSDMAMLMQGAVVIVGNSVTSGEANPPGDGAVYLLRLKSVTNGIVSGLGTDAAVGAFFSLNEFTDFASGGVTTEDLSLEDGLLQLRLR